MCICFLLVSASGLLEVPIISELRAISTVVNFLIAGDEGGERGGKDGHEKMERKRKWEWEWQQRCKLQWIREIYDMFDTLCTAIKVNHSRTSCGPRASTSIQSFNASDFEP